MADKKSLVTTENIESKILLIRGQKAMLDADLAELYGVETKTLNRAIKRNIERFPTDFMFQLTTDEFTNLKYQFGTSSWGGRRTVPFAFTEHGAIMAASVLNSQRAIEISVHVVRAFVHLRDLVSNNKELSVKLDQLERKVAGHDRAIAELINAIRQLMAPSAANNKRPIGFASWKDK
ncbi:MAG: ORF6N domain-containing protein [Nitrosomonadales bacterium]|nr:ORF6N domain-containing protein [Nitrosomonadales bacterium]